MALNEIRFRGIFLLTVALVSFAIAGCGLLGGNVSDLEGTKWTLDTVRGEALAPQFVVTAEFNDGRISGAAACNSYSASYETKKEELILGTFAVTEMACLDAGVMELEQSYLQLLGAVKSYQLSEGRLDLLDEGGGTVLSFHSS